MELASQVFDRITASISMHPDVKDLLPQLQRDDEVRYWRRVLRVAALCHDLGHLPFSHAAERELLPEGWNHEQLTAEIVKSMEKTWQSMTPPLRTDDIIKIAVGPRRLKAIEFNDWEAILSEIITGDVFGVDRMDYLLRDSHHAGVVYGKFDYHRLIDTLRILPKSQVGSREPCLGIEEGGLHSAEALLLARYFMYTQVYMHPVRRMYDIHLKDFLKAWLPDKSFPIDVEKHLKMSDIEILGAIIKAARDPGAEGHDPARRIVEHQHYRLLYQRNPDDVKKNPNSARRVFEAARREFGEADVRFDSYRQEGDGMDFPVLQKDGRIVSSLVVSETLGKIPVVAIDFVFISPEKRSIAAKWLRDRLDSIISGDG